MAMNPPIGDLPRPEDFYRIRRIDYPESDGEPMAETEAHGEVMEEIRSALKRRYAADPMVQVGGNCFMYYVDGDPKKCVAPDVYAIFGVPKEKRRVLKLWEEGKAPDVVFEVTSKSTRVDDLGSKKGLYAILGVREYFLYDPFGDYLEPSLQGFRLVGDDYVAIPGPTLQSHVLGLSISVAQGREALDFVDLVTGEAARSAVDQVAWEAQRAEQEAQRAEQEAQRAEQEAQGRRDAEARVAALEAQLAALKGRAGA